MYNYSEAINFLSNFFFPPTGTERLMLPHIPKANDIRNSIHIIKIYFWWNKFICFIIKCSILFVWKLPAAPSKKTIRIFCCTLENCRQNNVNVLCYVNVRCSRYNPAKISAFCRRNSIDMGIIYSTNANHSKWHLSENNFVSSQFFL